MLLDVTFDQNGDLDRESFLVKVVNGKQVVSETLPPVGGQVTRSRRASRSVARARAAGAAPTFRRRGPHGRSDPAHRLGHGDGAIYALAALGFTLLWQASGTINFAQGEFVMLPAFTMLAGIAIGPAAVGSRSCSPALAAMLVLGWGFKRVIVDPLIRHGVIPLVIATLGLAIALKTTVRAGYSAEAHQFASPFPAGQFAIAGINVSLRGRRHAGHRRRDRHRPADVRQHAP